MTNFLHLFLGYGDQFYPRIIFYNFFLFFVDFQTPWPEVRKEMVEEKGLDPSTADKIWEYVQLSGEFFLTLPCVKSLSLLV